MKLYPLPPPPTVDTTAIAALQASVAALNGKTDGLETAIDNLRSDLESLEVLITGANNATSLLSTALDAATADITQLKVDHNTQQALISALQDQIQTLKIGGAIKTTPINDWYVTEGGKPHQTWYRRRTEQADPVLREIKFEYRHTNGNIYPVTIADFTGLTPSSFWGWSARFYTLTDPGDMRVVVAIEQLLQRDVMIAIQDFGTSLGASNRYKQFRNVLFNGKAVDFTTTREI